MALANAVALFPSIELFSIKGVVAICIIEAVAYRFHLRVLASRERKVPLQDHVAVFGSFAIIAETACGHWAVPPLAIQLALMAVGIVTVILVGRRDWASELGHGPCPTRLPTVGPGEALDLEGVGYPIDAARPLRDVVTQQNERILAARE
jgi:hypothetical protein